MTDFSHAVSPRRMGRPPKQIGRKVVSKSYWLYPDALARARAHVGEQEVSRFIRDAIDEKLEREGAPPFDPVTMSLDAPKKPKPD